eukprot:TRINITY_DN42688_c0_g1_i1.p1 TRINITY_DN42688_c0_g1~~TRINITY_DN42688_c0_g1_i1.p1  ORF type:complete len:237 (-),score=45.90 TRINITY_DN42688_c0_g1_i1:73-756(-)
MFAVLNVITGVFCQTAIEAAASNIDLVTVKLKEDKENLKGTIRNIFNMFDEDKSDSVSYVEFMEKLEEDECVSMLASLQIEVHDAWTLLRLIDQDSSGEVDMDEFVDGILKLRGPAKATHMAEARYENKMMRRKIKEMEMLCIKTQKSTEKVAHATQSISTSLLLLQSHRMSAAAPCKPTAQPSQPLSLGSLPDLSSTEVSLNPNENSGEMTSAARADFRSRKSLSL